ncbi:Acyl-CoA N-acyltransferase [Penicillium macrosclerotiorum]|uniref:Acyl-CoA N-acyltransferase n=1 Tax=Penicillium macrosclerotiorum TaxID=303699 RepID=UPI0025491D6E|nr:Acyl-CoA N-acyltransferase [Penicillium macrosclerotiorum]KAJ5691970.1 Acyl-CoA N-acyltransferase [Penicillium macrosclerotiorum]
MTTPSALRLEPATLEDIPAIAELWFEVFTDPMMRHLFPPTPGVRQWWEKANRDDFINKPFQRYVKIVDPESNNANGQPRLVAYAKWDLAMVAERGSRFPPWHEDQPAGDCDNFFGSLEKERQRVMGDRKNFYLDMLGTHPEYRKRGAGSMLVKWGCDLADDEGAGAYVDASKAGAPLYEKFGFVDHSQPDTIGIASMARR